MSDFNPEEYLKRKQQESEFNPEEYLKKKKEVGFFEGLSNVVSAPATLVRSAVTGQFSETLGKALSPDIARLGEDVPSWKDIFAEKGIPTSYGYEPVVIDSGEFGKTIGMQEKMKNYPSPATIAGGVADVAIDPLNLVAGVGAVKATNPILRKLAVMSETAIGRSLSPYITKSELISKGVSPEVVSKRLYDLNLEGQLSNPEKLRQTLGGLEYIETPVNTAGKMINKKVERGSGIIGEHKQIIDDIISSSNKDVPNVNRQSIASEISLDRQYNQQLPTSTELPHDIAKKEKLTREILKSDDIEDASLQDLIDLKRDNARYLNSKDYVNAANADRSLALEKEVRIDVDRFLKNKIRDMIPENKIIMVDGKEVNAKHQFDYSNQIQHQLLQVSDALEPAKLERYSTPGKVATLGTLASGGMAGFLAGEALNMPYSGMIGLGLGAGAAAKTLARKGIQPILASTYGSMAKSPKIMKSLSAISAQIPAEALQSKGRKPQSIEEVALMKLPRSTEEAIQSPELLIEKVKMLDPNSVPVVMSAINEDPEKLPDVMFSLSQQFPHAFDSDKYGRFDGKIPAQTMMQFIGDLRDDKSISNTERAKYMNDALVKKQSHYTPQ